MTRSSIRTRILGWTMIALAVSAGVAMAGPPLLCHPFDIGTARSLPWDATNDWRGRASATNLDTLVADTQALLTPATPVIVRMETLRRAALYAGRDAKVATQLLEALQKRAGGTQPLGTPSRGASDPMATFDAGYLVETFRQIAELGARDREWQPHMATLNALVKDTDGYALIQKSLASRTGDPAMEFASALISASANRRTASAHAQKAKAGIAQDALLARNIGHLSGL